jgi:hypothetical protein
LSDHNFVFPPAVLRQILELKPPLVRIPDILPSSLENRLSSFPIAGQQLKPSQQESISKDLMRGAKISDVLNLSRLGLRCDFELLSEISTLRQLDLETRNFLTVVSLNSFIAWIALTEQSESLPKSDPLINSLALGITSDHKEITQTVFSLITDFLLLRARDESDLPNPEILTKFLIETKSIQTAELIIRRIMALQFPCPDAYFSKVIAAVSLLVRSDSAPFSSQNRSNNIRY